MVTMKNIITLVIFSLCVFMLNAQNIGEANDVVLVVSGDGNNKEEATNVALRSAIEQTFGTFVSSNTEILNDSLVKDEIITVSSGNIRHFEYVTEYLKSSRYFVTLKATIAIGKLVEYTKSKGAKAELAGAFFAAKVKMNKFYAENEMKVLHNLRKEIKPILPYIFNYEIKVEDPTEVHKNGLKEYHCKAKIVIKPNKNLLWVQNVFRNTLNSISMSYEERQEFEKIKKENPILIKGGGKIDGNFYEHEYHLRNTKHNLIHFFNKLEEDIVQAALSFKVIDDLGEYVVFETGMDEKYNYQISALGFSSYLIKYHLSELARKRFININKENGLFSSLYIQQGYRGNVVDESSIFSIMDRNIDIYWNIFMTLRYSLDEISKISNISIVPLLNKRE